MWSKRNVEFASPVGETGPRRLIGPRRSCGHRRELDMQPRQPAQHVRRYVVEPPLTRFAVHALVEPDVAQTGQQAFEADAGLQSGKRPPRACVDSAAEGQV